MLVDLILTIFGYLLVPVIIALRGKKYPKSKIKHIAIYNAVVVWLIFAIIIVNAGGKPTSGAVFLWGYVGYWLMTKKCLKELEDVEYEEEAE